MKRRAMTSAEATQQQRDTDSAALGVGLVGILGLASCLIAAAGTVLTR